MLTASAVTRLRGGRTVLDAVSLRVGPRSRIGIVGPNGVGKTTLLRVLAGLEEPDGGRVERAPATLTVGYLPQETDARPGETLRAYLARRTGVAAAGAELDRLTEAMAADPAAVDAYSEALERFLALGGGDLDARAGDVVAGVGLPADRLDVEVGALSGGQAARAALAAVLLARFDVFLLDEPTNNLDFAGLDRLEGFLDGLAGGVALVSHDRAFLDRTVERIVELGQRDHRAVEYAGGWSDYVAARRLARAQQYAAHGRNQAQRRELADRARTQRQWAHQGVARAKRDPKDNDKAQRGFAKNRTEKQASKLRATERRLERLEDVDKPWEGWQLRLSLAPSARSGDVVARLDGAVVERGSFTLGPVDLEVRWQERVAVLGPNGSGKTTLLRALLGEVPLAAGARWLGPGVVVGAMDQSRMAPAGGETVLGAFLAATGLPVPDGRSLLAKFALGAADVDRPAAELSPGERSRGILATLMARGVNCLVLDEPTNHLDLPAIEQLEEALGAFEGTLLVVTHDRRFLEALHVTRTVGLEALSATRSRVGP
ncbi:MAG TPA: ABC-F family ATP-binding cassette domain-containing protein [Acidimicrobiales bacterium]|nr:ABC-F family ATP-binding cassette domain-containing protein [Acidimicrobiales bacterium]